MGKTIRIAGALVLCFFMGCAQKPSPPAVVNGEVISREALDREVTQRLRMHERDAESVDPAAMREAVLNQLIDERLLVQAARKQGITANEDVVGREFSSIRDSYADAATFVSTLKERGLTEETFRDKLRERNILEQFVDSLAGDTEISEESLKSHFDSVKSPPMMPERVKMRFIQVPDKARAEEIARRIRDGGREGFDAVADELTGSEGIVVSAENWVQPGTFSLKMTEVIKGLSSGEWAGPVETKVAMYLVKVYAREDARPKTFEEAKDELKMIMVSRIHEDAVNNWLAAERPKANIVKGAIE